MTSAPRSPSICVAYGPSTTEVRSSTRTPASGPAFLVGCDAATFDASLAAAHRFQPAGAPLRAGGGIAGELDERLREPGRTAAGMQRRREHNIVLHAGRSAPTRATPGTGRISLM